MSRWEVGSSFALARADEDMAAHSAFAGGELFGSGRQALAAVLRHGGYTAVHLPSYYCPAVVDDIATVLPVRRYHASPLGDLVPPVVGPTEAVVTVAYFGAEPLRIPGLRGTLIVDTTHDPLLPVADADYVVASLRKTLPVPDGGVLWSPRGHSLPVAGACTDRHLTATSTMLAAMALKAEYLDGGPLPKSAYLDRLRQAEELFDGCPPGAVSTYSRNALPTFPVHAWHRRRARNIALLRAALGPEIDTLPGTFGVVLRFESGWVREAVRAGLVANDVYPAVLWDLTGTDAPAQHVELSHQLLFVHADHRYSADDMRRVARLVQELVRLAGTASAPAGTAGPAGIAGTPGAGAAVGAVAAGIPSR